MDLQKPADEGEDLISSMPENTYNIELNGMATGT